MSRAESILSALAARRRVAQRVIIVAAHPDDETLGLGAQLCRFDNALLVHATDGAPRDGEDARNYGFRTQADYAAARRQELAAALRAGAAEQVRTLCLNLPDKQAMADLPSLTRRLAELLRAENPAAVFTHAYEGGHPDHDSVAFAVHAACLLFDRPPAILEFPLYYRAEGRMVAGRFPRSAAPEGPSPARREWAVDLNDRDILRKRAMLDCFVTQRWLFEPFDLSVEHLRPAPEYDFREPPHPGELHYETLGWGITGAEWRGVAAAALTCLGLAAAACR
jgi:LmbE family N-acetylglucosaminyl deacetylase